MPGTRMSAADAAWLRMDRPDNLMVVNSLLLLERPVEHDEVLKLLDERLVERFPKFRQHVREPVLPLGRPRWEDEPDFDVRDHVHHVRLVGDDDESMLQRYVGEQMAIALPSTIPPWELHVIEGLDDGGALLFRMHHCIADGISLAQVLMSMADGEDAGRVTGDGAAGPPLWRTALHGLTEAVRHPSRAATAGRSLPAVAAVLGRDLMLRSDTRTHYAGAIGPAKHAVWTPPIPLEPLRDVAHAHGVTINDVLVSAVSGALRAYLEHRGETIRDIRAMVPFNLRALDRPVPRDLGNQFGLVLLTLPLTVADHIERLAVVHRHMDAIKHSPEPQVSYGLLSSIGMTAERVERGLVEFFASKASGVLTNVPGPQYPVSMGGVTITRIIGWGPRSGHQSLGIAIFSYNHEVTVAFGVDAHTVEEPHRLVAHVMDELRLLSQWTLAAL